MGFRAPVLGPEAFFFQFLNLLLAILSEAGAQTLAAFYRTYLFECLFFSVLVKNSM